jgi:AraC-like DNA-binding protein
MFANPITTAPAEELLVQSILMGLPHNRSALLRCQTSAAAPGNIRRAEEFIRSNADKTITLEGIARAVGCSVRALQLGFRRFRDTSPMAALRQARLERARNDILRSDGSLSVIGVATRARLWQRGPVLRCLSPSLRGIPVRNNAGRRADPALSLFNSNGNQRACGLPREWATTRFHARPKNTWRRRQIFARNVQTLRFLDRGEGDMPCNLPRAALPS